MTWKRGAENSRLCTTYSQNFIYIWYIYIITSTHEAKIAGQPIQPGPHGIILSHKKEDKRKKHRNVKKIQYMTF